MSENRRPTTQRSGSQTRRSPQHGTPVKKRPAQSRQVKKRKKKKNEQMFDFETLVALILIVLTLIGAIVLIVNGVKNCNCGTEPKQVEYVANANIKPEETPTPVPTEEPQATADIFASENTDAPVYTEVVVTATPVPQTQTYVSNGQLRSATIRTVGDFVIHDTVFKSAKRLGKETKVYEYDFSPMLSYIKNYIGNADFTVTNVDGCLGGKDAYKYGYSGYPQFNTPEYIMYALKDCGVDMLTLANNHMLDTWYDGLQKTIANVDKVGLRHIGANKSLADKNAPYIVEINGIKVGFMNYTEDLNSMDQQKSLDKRALEFGVNAIKNSDCAAYAATLRAAGADVIVAFMHWGTEYQSNPDSDQEYYANMLVKAGVDVIMGGHPHVVQPAKWLTGTNQFGEQQKTLCVYSIGNFLSDQRGVDTSGGVIFDFTIQEKTDGTFEIVSPGYMPTWVWRTGSSDSDYNYYVLPTQNYLKTRPAQMSNSDYEAMLNNYDSVIKVMQKGVGNLITE